MQLQGLTIQEIIALTHTKKLWEDKEIRTMVSGMKQKSMLTTNQLKEGDIICNTITNHPCVVIKIINNEIAHAASITSEEKTACIIMKCNSRFFREHYLTESIVSITHEKALEGICGVYDCPSDIKEYKKLLKKHYKTIL